MRHLIFLCVLIPLSAAAQRPNELLKRLNQASDQEKPAIFLALSEALTENQPDSAVHYAGEGIHLAEKQKDQPQEATLLLQLGKINALHHHHLLARRFYAEALTIYQSLRNAEGTARCEDAIGQLDGLEKKVSLAAGELDKAAKHFAGQRDSSGTVEAWEELAGIYAENGQADKALVYYQKALDYYERHGKMPAAYYVVLENMSRLYQKKGDSQAAMHLLDRAIRNSRLQPGAMEVQLLNEEGLVLQQNRDPLKALTVFKEALADARKYRQPEQEAETLIHIAELLKQQSTSTSLADLKIALGIASKLREPQLEARIYAAMAGVYRQGKNYKEAMDALEEQHRLVDSLLNADTTKEIAAMDSSYQLENSREKISGLQTVNSHENTELVVSLTTGIFILVFTAGLWFYLRKVRRLNESLQTSNRIKDTLFSVIGHDLKGPAGSAAQLFELMETEDFTEAEFRSMIAELRVQTGASLELLQSLFEWGKAQMQGILVNPSDFDPGPVAERCMRLLSRQAAQKNIALNNELPAHLSIHADADQFELIIRNLVSNAIKFTHNQGHIEVGAQVRNKEEIIFYVRDSGIGISPSQQALFLTSNLHVNFGTGKEKGSGLGLLLVKDFVRANQGRVWLESEEGRGTTFFISLPAAA